MMIKACRLLIITSIAMLGYTNAYSADEIVNERVSGSALFDLDASTDLFEIKDDKYWLIESGLWTSEFSIQSVRNNITFGIDESNMTYESTYSRKIIFDIDYEKLVNGQLVTETITGIELEINYNPIAGSTYEDRAVFSFSGGLSMKIDVIDIQYEATPGSGTWISAPDLPNAVYLESEISVERFYPFDQYFIPSPNFNFSTVNGELIVNWQLIEGAEEYELEWSWVNGYTGEISGGVPVVESDVSNLKYNFISNSSSVRLKGKNEYAIPLIYGDGYLVFRYRGIGYSGTHHNVPIEGLWSSSNLVGDAAGLLSDYGTINQSYVQVSAHESNNYNYGAGMSFIENGVRSVGVTYMDGVLKPRQSQAKLNTQDKIIVGSTIYDHHGRPGIGVMSSPVNQSSLGYVDNLNMYNSTTPYDKSNFDLDQANPVLSCGTLNAAPPMDSVNSVGAAHYYSNSNVDKEGANAYLPTSEGYPFVHVQYTADPTGRIKKVGGLGPNHQLGETNGTNAAHYTEYFYSTPDENETWMLFGNEAARPENYTKVITKDVHGQFSVAIIDAMGRTVATYLEGTAPAGLETIEGNTGLTPTGMQMPGRNGSLSVPDYRYAFNGLEDDSEVSGSGNHYDLKFRAYNSRLGRFFSTDPIGYEYPYNSPYAYAENRVVDGVDLEGKEYKKKVKVDRKTGTRKVIFTLKGKGMVAPAQLTGSTDQTSKAEMKILVEELNNRMNKIYSGYDPETNTYYEFRSKIKPSSYDSQELEAPTTINIVFMGDEAYNPSGSHTGQTRGEIGEFRTNVVDVHERSQRTTELREVKNITRTAAHELGHVAGLEHPWDPDNKITDIKQYTTDVFEADRSDVDDETIKNNIMNSQGNWESDLGNNFGDQVTLGQLKFMAEHITTGKENREFFRDKRKTEHKQAKIKKKREKANEKHQPRF